MIARGGIGRCAEHGPTVCNGDLRNCVCLSQPAKRSIGSTATEDDLPTTSVDIRGTPRNTEVVGPIADLSHYGVLSASVCLRRETSSSRFSDSVLLLSISHPRSRVRSKPARYQSGRVGVRSAVAIGPFRSRCRSVYALPNECDYVSAHRCRRPPQPGDRIR